MKIKINISLDNILLQDLDKIVSKSGFNRSSFITHLIRNYIDVVKNKKVGIKNDK